MIGQASTKSPGELIRVVGSLSELRLALVGVLVLVGAWPVFIFTGSQVAYVAATLAACLGAVALVYRRTPVAVGYLLGVVALVGPDANGQLGNGHPPLGSLRLVDAAIGSAALTAAWVARREFVRPRRASYGLALLTTVALGYAVIRWAMEGHRVDSFLRTDVRLVLLTILMSFVVWRCRRGNPRTILWSLVIVGVLSAGKAALIQSSNLFAIGSYDRLQATSYFSSGHVRTILVGGDTVLILAPSIALLLASTLSLRVATRAALALAGLVCIGGLSLSATRSSVLVAFGLVALVGGAVAVMQRPRLRSRSALAVAALIVVALGLATLNGAASRLFRQDAPHTGLDFRKDEVNSFLTLPIASKYLGQGLGGRFRGKDTHGQPVMSAWAHELPVWIALKDGIFGLLCAVIALALLARRGWQAFRRGGDRLRVLAGGAIVLGLVVMSMTIGRLALVEGAVPLVVGVFLISASARQATDTAP